MNALSNRVQLIGNLGNEPEIINFDSGKTLVKASLATNETYKNKEGKKVTDTSWHKLAVWGKTGELLAELGTKGSKVAVEGKLTYRTWENKEGGSVNDCEIVVSDFLLLDPKGK
ncbi:single-stranded DNA-binding protein [Flagellimonas flava]|uniref:single-stranded DNA-binding protein n=1 Tax=Flagellimonas flava TaxID=570519 RepID=UPI003D66069E